MISGKTIQVTSPTEFHVFSSISIIDAGTDGFQIKLGATDSVWIQIPTSIPYNFGRMDEKKIDYLAIRATPSKSLNASVSIVY